MDWQPLSVRTGARQAPALMEGMPDHLRFAIGQWLRDQFGWNDSQGMRHSVMADLVTALRIPVRETHALGGISDQIFGALEADEALYLDAVDYMLWRTGNPGRDRVRRILESGGSAWTVNREKAGLERRVSASATAAMQAVVQGKDVVASEIGEAWSAAFGLNPDPSDAWDHAIKAVEEVLIPVVLPGVAKPNLGGVAGELISSAPKWNLPLRPSGNRNTGETLSDMLRFIWPNPDRHGGGNGRRTPTQEEAEATVHLAVAIVQMCRDGRLSKS